MQLSSYCRVMYTHKTKIHAYNHSIISIIDIWNKTFFQEFLIEEVIKLNQILARLGMSL